MERELQDQLTARALDVLETAGNDAERLARWREVHPDERRLGEIMWRVWRQTRDSRLAVAPVIRWMAQASSDTFDVGDFQALSTALSQRDDLGFVATKDGLLWNHALETLVEKIGRDCLLVDVGTLHPRLRQAFRFALLRHGWVSATDLRDDGPPVAEALVRGWDDARLYAWEWMHDLHAPEVGRLLAIALGSVGWRHPEPVILAAPYTTASEAVAIALNLEDPRHGEHAQSLLNGHRDEVFELLHGRQMSLVTRAFGPSISSWWVGVTGLLGPPGVVGAAAVVLSYQVLGLLPLYQFLGIFLGSAALVRAWIQRPRKPAIQPENLDQTTPGVHILASWYARSCQEKAVRPLPNWPSKGLLRLEINDDDLVKTPKKDYANATPEPDLHEAWILRWRTTPTEFRSTWATRRFWPTTQRCLFGAYNGYDELTLAFRIDESGELVDVFDQPVELPAYHTIGLVQSVDLDDEQRARWSEVFADYEIVGAFDQLGTTSEAIPIVLRDGAREILVGDGWLSDDEGLMWRRPLASLGCTLLIEVEPPFAEDAERREVMALTLAEGLLFEEPGAIQKVRTTQRIEKQLGHWAAELRRRVGA